MYLLCVSNLIKSRCIIFQFFYTQCRVYDTPLFTKSILVFLVLWSWLMYKMLCIHKFNLQVHIFNLPFKNFSSCPAFWYRNIKWKKKIMKRLCLSYTWEEKENKLEKFSVYLFCFYSRLLPRFLIFLGENNYLTVQFCIIEKQIKFYSGRHQISMNNI